ncbi:MAG: glutamine--fructose-6-phosphate transaminase (isomerizing) [Cyclobacteriaceae bacterium]|nr:glutamine--fructose-6-phosphate transaminase (isomerizing) [Cyclobacteriaceae bacterium]
MCGIIAYSGKKNAVEIIIKGLKRLEYRGYDSAGLACIENNLLTIHKKKGRVLELESYVKNSNLQSGIAMGHTRWATHGSPNDTNAHPHTNTAQTISIIHNGIIENYEALRKELQNKGYKFRSETDSEVFVHLIDHIYQQQQCDIETATRMALSHIVGAYALVVMSQDEPDTLIAARKGSPLVIGIGDGEYFLASDATPIVEYTQKVVFLNDFEIATINSNGLHIKDSSNIPLSPLVQQIELELEAIEKGGFEHFMLKEIFEQPLSVHNAMRGRIQSHSGKIVLGGLRDYIDKLAQADRIIFLGCGTSWHSALVAEYFFEEYCRIPVEVEYASEFRYRNPIIRKNDVVIAISQSGETADTLAAMEIARDKGALVLGICNVVGSSIARNSTAGCYLHAGPEIGVASTKAFTAQLTVLFLVALEIAQKKETIKEDALKTIMTELESIPAKIEKALQLDAQIKYISSIFKFARNFLYLGRGFNYPVALEGALKLKEISYIHAEGYPAAEMKHGPIALIDEQMPVVFIATKDSSYEKIISNIQEVKARKGEIIAVVTEGDRQLTSLTDHLLEIPATHESLTPLLSVIPLQLMAYHIAVMRGCNVDQPRNLAKSVTVE